MYVQPWRVGAVAAASIFFWEAVSATYADLAADLAVLRAVSSLGHGNRPAVTAWRNVAQAEAGELPRLLAALDGANPLAANYLRAAVDAVAERALRDGKRLPASELEAFVLDGKHDARGRRLAFEWLSRQDGSAPDRLIPRMLDDRSLELRRDAVARVLNEAQRAAAAGDAAAAAAAYDKAFHAARDQDQVQQAADALAKLGKAPDLVAHFGWITRWHLVAPFDNTDGKGFEAVYPPESAVDLSATYRGKGGTPITWKEFTTTDPMGMVDLTKALDKHKGAVAYAAADFFCDVGRDVELRLGCINANKLWVNGNLVLAHDVYHTGQSLDQYVGRARLRAGRNSILLKVCQNEQTEAWAQSWQFQLRVCDEIGTAVPSKEP